MFSNDLLYSIKGLHYVPFGINPKQQNKLYIHIEYCNS